MYLWIANLPFVTTPDDLYQLLTKHSLRPLMAQCLYGERNRPKGQALVEVIVEQFPEELNGLEYRGRKLIVDEITATEFEELRLETRENAGDSTTKYYHNLTSLAIAEISALTRGGFDLSEPTLLEEKEIGLFLFRAWGNGTLSIKCPDFEFFYNQNQIQEILDLINLTTQKEKK